MPRTGHDPPCSRSWPGRCYFNPRAPYGARPGFALITVWNIWISIHVPRTGHDDALFHLSHHRGISIHVPRTGHDRGAGRCGESTGISIHVPRTGHDEMRIVHEVQYMIFQSTCPVQGTTSAYELRLLVMGFQSTCPVQGTTSEIRKNRRRKCDFNPRAPYRARRDGTGAHCRRYPFQSTCPVQGTTRKQTRFCGLKKFQSTCPVQGTTAKMHK